MCEAANRSIRLHEIFNRAKRYGGEYSSLDENYLDKLPTSAGVYIFFEKGEKYEDYDRIVRVGISKNLKNRLKNHLERENKNRSIFRKNVGRAILNRDGDGEFLRLWNIKNGDAKRYDESKYMEIENRVTEYLNDNTQFVFFNTQRKRAAEFEKLIISTLCNDPNFVASDNWLGRYVPSDINCVAKCGMWVTQHTRQNEIITEGKIKEIEELISKTRR